MENLTELDSSLGRVFCWWLCFGERQKTNSLVCVALWPRSAGRRVDTQHLPSWRRQIQKHNWHIFLRAPLLMCWENTVEKSHFNGNQSAWEEITRTALCTTRFTADTNALDINSCHAAKWTACSLSKLTKKVGLCLTASHSRGRPDEQVLQM